MKDINIKINLINNKAFKIDDYVLKMLAAKEIKKRKLKGNFEIDFSIIGDSEITELNSKYMHKNSSTDVLSFPIFNKNRLKSITDNIMSPTLLGEIIISLDSAKINAKCKNISINNELMYLFIHGLNHLLGYHHK